MFNVEEEGNRQFAEVLKEKRFRVGWISDIRFERIFQFTAKTIPTPSIRILIQAQINRETLDNRTEVKE